MTTLGIIVGILAVYGFYSAACNVGKWLKRQRIAQEEAEKVINEYGKDKGSGSN